MKLTASHPTESKPRLQAVCNLWPLPANETIALAIYAALWTGIALGALLQKWSEG